MNPIFANIVALLTLAQDAFKLGINLDKEIGYKVKELADKLPSKIVGPFFIVDGETVERPNTKEMDMFKQGEKLHAIKMYKERTGRSLMISKHAIEQC